MARARAQVEDAARAIIDGRDLIDVAERALLRPLDDKAQGEIAAAAKRVSLVTAISPRAILDVLFVVAQIVRLVRRIAEIYGGRPGLLGLIKLARSIGAHIAITGGMAVGDSLLQQLVGHGIASRISARMGEGVLNGLLTARVGLSALAVCRPMPFSVDKPPGVSDVAPFLFSKGRGLPEERVGAEGQAAVAAFNPPARAPPARRSPARRYGRRTSSPASASRFAATASAIHGKVMRLASESRTTSASIRSSRPSGSSPAATSAGLPISTQEAMKSLACGGGP